MSKTKKNNQQMCCKKKCTKQPHIVCFPLSLFHICSICFPKKTIGGTLGPSFLAVSLPLSANLAMAPLGVAFEAWPPVLLYISSGGADGDGKPGGKPWENHGKTMENHGKTMENHK
jgi:hypothetical protein